MWSTGILKPSPALPLGMVDARFGAWFRCISGGGCECVCIECAETLFVKGVTSSDFVAWLSKDHEQSGGLAKSISTLWCVGQVPALVAALREILVPETAGTAIDLAVTGVHIFAVPPL